MVATPLTRLKSPRNLEPRVNDTVPVGTGNPTTVAVTTNTVPGYGTSAGAAAGPAWACTDSNVTVGNRTVADAGLAANSVPPAPRRPTSTTSTVAKRARPK